MCRPIGNDMEKAARFRHLTLYRMAEDNIVERPTRLGTSELSGKLTRAFLAEEASLLQNQMDAERHGLLALAHLLDLARLEPLEELQLADDSAH